MPLGDFVDAGTSARPLPIGRVARLGSGLGTGFFFIWLVLHYRELVGAGVPDAGWWAGVGVSFWYFSDLVVIGFGRGRGRWPQVALFPFALALIIADLVVYGSAWAPPLGWGLLIFTAFFFGSIAISFVLAAAFAVPG